MIWARSPTSMLKHKYVKTHKASTVPEMRAVLMLMQKVKHVPELHQHMHYLYKLVLTSSLYKTHAAGLHGTSGRASQELD